MAKQLKLFIGRGTDIHKAAIVPKGRNRKPQKLYVVAYSQAEAVRLINQGCGVDNASSAHEIKTFFSDFPYDESKRHLHNNLPLEVAAYGVWDAWSDKPVIVRLTP